MIKDNDQGYYTSINNRCSIFIAEALAISEALKKIWIERVKKDVLILTDSLSVIQGIINNDIDVYKNKFILETKKTIL